MTANRATPEEIARLRSDIATIRSAIDDSLPFTRTDIRFYWVFVAAFGVCMAIEVLGWTKGMSRWLAVMPLVIPTLAYLGYLWRKSLATSQTRPVVKKEYRFAIIGGPLLLAGLLLLRKWAASLSISEHVFNGIGLSMVGLLIFIASFFSFSSACRYRRISMRYLGIMTGLTGLAVPYIRPESIYLAACVFGIVSLVPFTLWSQSLLKRQENSDPSTANAL